jgi:glycine/D-amino acid oxidase-like deaminating enzyme
MTRRASTVLVGGGIWGLSTAYHPVRAGRAYVQVLE